MATDEVKLETLTEVLTFGQVDGEPEYHVIQTDDQGRVIIAP
jgi:hypothetical protein